MKTAEMAQGLAGEKLYQQRARKCLPLLVRQAAAEQPIVYGDLAAELGMPNPRNLNYVLGSIGQAIKELSENWSDEIPPIQCLVINANTGLPGEGIGWFVTNLKDDKKLPRRQQRQIVAAELVRIYAYAKWPEVLAAFELSPFQTDFTRTLSQAGTFESHGESDSHRELKEYVAKHPQVVGLPQSVGVGDVEHSLPSGDLIDVHFRNKQEEIGVEVKSHISSVADITRGLFQCVKYQAVLEARQAAEQRPKNGRAVLVLAASLPDELLALKHVLGVQVYENVQGKPPFQ